MSNDPTIPEAETETADEMFPESEGIEDDVEALKAAVQSLEQTVERRDEKMTNLEDTVEEMSDGISERDEIIEEQQELIETLMERMDDADEHRTTIVMNVADVSKRVSSLEGRAMEGGAVLNAELTQMERLLCKVDDLKDIDGDKRVNVQRALVLANTWDHNSDDGSDDYRDGGMDYEYIPVGIAKTVLESHLDETLQYKQIHDVFERFSELFGHHAECRKPADETPADSWKILIPAENKGDIYWTEEQYDEELVMRHYDDDN